jgi:hypothetical protein
MSLRVGFDLDGVLADMDSALALLAGRMFGPRVKRRPRWFSNASDGAAPEPGVADDADAPPLHGVQLTRRQQSGLWKVVRAIDGFWETLVEIEPGAVARLAEVAAERRWEIIFLTRRPATAGRTAQIQSQRWLIANGFPLPSVFVVNGSRGRIASSLDLDIVVDDTPENCVDVATDSKARAIAVFRDPEQPMSPALTRLGIHVVRSVDECIKMLCEIDAGVEQRPGAIDRVMKILGLKQPTGT